MHYDVIIIGTGAGGGTLASQAGAHRQEDSDSGARRLRATREGQLEHARGQRGGQVQHQRSVAATATARNCIRTPTTTWAATRSSMARRCSACAKRTSARSITTAAFLPPGRSPTTIWSRTTTQAEHTITCTASAARIRPIRRRRCPYPHPAVSHEPRIQQLSDDFAAAGLEAVPHAAGRHAGREESAHEQMHPLQHLRRLSMPGPCEVRRAGARRRSGARTTPNVRLMTNAYVERLETSASGREVTKVMVRQNGAPRSSPPMSWWFPAARSTPRRLLLRSANDKHPNGLANGSDVVGRHYMGHVNSVLMAVSKCPNPTVFQKTLSVNDFYFGSTEWQYPMGHISFVGKLDGDRAARRRAGHCTRIHARHDGQSLARFLADFGRSARPRTTA